MPESPHSVSWHAASGPASAVGKVHSHLLNSGDSSAGWNTQASGGNSGIDAARPATGPVRTAESVSLQALRMNAVIASAGVSIVARDMGGLFLAGTGSGLVIA